MKKKVISALLATAMVATMVAGCGSKAETPGASGDSNAAGTETASTNGEYPVIRHRGRKRSRSSGRCRC